MSFIFKSIIKLRVKSIQERGGHLSTVTYQRKKEILDDLLEEASKMEYQSKKEDIQIFTQKLQTVLPYLFENHSEKLSAFYKIKFRPSMYALGVDNTELFTKSFLEGKQATINFISGLIHAVDFEQSLVPQETSTPQIPSESPIENKNVFIVHGHDDALKNEVARFIESLNLKAVILHEESDRGQTIISKFATHSDVGFAIILYTPCDLGRASSVQEERPRARQNVIFEHGYFVAKLGIENVVALKKGDVELPNDLSGVIYKEYDQSGAWKYKIANELEESGYEIDYKSIR